MHAALVVLLIASTSSAPALPPLPEGLPPAVETPFERCEAGPGVWLPLKRADAIDLQRQQCKVLPERCQAALDEDAELLKPRMDLAHAQGRVEGLEEGMKAPWGDRLTWGAVGAIIGVLAGIIVGLEASR